MLADLARMASTPVDDPQPRWLHRTDTPRVTSLPAPQTSEPRTDPVLMIDGSDVHATTAAGAPPRARSKWIVPALAFAAGLALTAAIRPRAAHSRSTALAVSSAPETAVASRANAPGRNDAPAPESSAESSLSVTDLPTSTPRAPRPQRREAARAIAQSPARTLAPAQADLGVAIRQAVGVTDPIAAESSARERDTAALADRPAQGAVASAVAGPVRDARRCLADDDEPVTALLAFQSSGLVDTVTLRGARSTTAPCLEAALSKARIEPFARPTFTVRVTLRPL